MCLKVGILLNGHLKCLNGKIKSRSNCRAYESPVLMLYWEQLLRFLYQFITGLKAGSKRGFQKWRSKTGSRSFLPTQFAGGSSVL